MNEEEMKAIEELKEEISRPVEVPEDKFDTFILYNIENAKIILNLISKLQKEVKEEGTELAHIAKLFNQNTNRLETISRKLGLTKKNENGFIYDEIVKEVDKLQKELDKKDKIIDLMAQALEDLNIAHFKKDNGFYRLKNKDELKEEFFKKVEEENV